MALSFTVHEVACMFVSICVEIVSRSLTLAFHKFSVKLVTMLPVESPMTMLFVFDVHTFIAIFIRVFVCTRSVFLTFVVLTFEVSSIVVLLHSFSLSLTIFIGSLENISVFIGVLSFTILLSILIVSFENGTSFILVCAESLLDSVDVFTLKLGSIFIVVDSRSLPLIIQKSSSKLLLRRQVVYTLTMLLPCFKGPLIFVAVREIHNAHTLWHSTNCFTFELITVLESNIVVLGLFL